MQEMKRTVMIYAVCRVISYFGVNGGAAWNEILYWCLELCYWKRLTSHHSFKKFISFYCLLG